MLRVLHQVCLQVSSLSFSCYMAVSMEDNDEILHLTSTKILTYSVFLLKSSSAFQICRICIKKAAHGLKAPSDSSLGSVSVLVRVQLNPRAHTYNGPTWLAKFDMQSSLCNGVRACYGEGACKGKRGSGICGDKTKASVTERWRLFFFSCCLLAVEQRPSF